MPHREIYPLFPSPQPHDPKTGKNLGDSRLPTLPQMRVLAERGFRNKQYLTMTRDHEDIDEVGRFTDFWLDETTGVPRLMASIEFDDTDNGVIAQEAVKTRAYDAISAEWKPVRNPETGETEDFILFGASITPMPRMNGGTGGCFVVGWPGEEKTNVTNDSRYKASIDQPENTQKTTLQILSQKMSDTEKASLESQPMEGVSTPPAKLQNVEEAMSQSHPQDTGRGGKIDDSEIRIPQSEWQAVQTRMASLAEKFTEQEKALGEAKKQREEEQKRRQAEFENQRREKLVAHMKTCRQYRDQVWNANREILARNGLLKASMDRVEKALDSNDVDAFSKIDGLEYLVASMQGELDVYQAKTEQEKQAQRERQLKEQARAEADERAQRMIAQQLGMLENLEKQASRMALPEPVPSPSGLYTNTSTTSSTSAPMQIQEPYQQQQQQQSTGEPLKASMDSGLQNSSSTSQKQKAMIDAFEAQYGVKRSQVTEVRIKASADVQEFLQSGPPGSRSSARTQERFNGIKFCSDLLRQAQLEETGQATLDVEGVLRASMESSLHYRAIPYKATDMIHTGMGTQVMGSKITPYYG